MHPLRRGGGRVHFAQLTTQLGLEGSPHSFVAREKGAQHVHCRKRNTGRGSWRDGGAEEALVALQCLSSRERRQCHSHGTDRLTCGDLCQSDKEGEFHHLQGDRDLGVPSLPARGERHLSPGAYRDLEAHGGNERLVFGQPLDSPHQIRAAQGGKQGGAEDFA